MKNNTTDTVRSADDAHGGQVSTGWPAELSDRAVYPTAIGPVCMSKTEHAAYLEELERRGIDPDSYDQPIGR